MAEPKERIGRAGGAEHVPRRRRVVVGAQQVALGQHPVDLLGGLLGAGHQRHRVAHDDRQQPGEQRVVRAAEHERVDAGGVQRRQVGLGQAEQLPAAGDPALDELGERGQAALGDRDAGAAANASS